MTHEALSGTAGADGCTMADLVRAGGLTNISFDKRGGALGVPYLRSISLRCRSRNRSRHRAAWCAATQTRHRPSRARCPTNCGQFLQIILVCICVVIFSRVSFGFTYSSPLPNSPLFQQLRFPRRLPRSTEGTLRLELFR